MQAPALYSSRVVDRRILPRTSWARCPAGRTRSCPPARRSPRRSRPRRPRAAGSRPAGPRLASRRRRPAARCPSAGSWTPNAATQPRRFPARRRRFLDLLRVDVAAAGDDHVLGAAGDEEIAVLVDEAKVAGVDPAAVAHHRAVASGSRSSPASTTGRGTGCGLRCAPPAARRIVDDAQLVARDRPATGDERQRLWIVGRGRARSPARAGTPPG